MKDPRWWWSRLRAMSPAEVATRSWRAARHPIDRARMRLGWYARPPRELASWRGPERFYVSRDDARAPLDAAWRERADNICAGKREVLGLGWLELGDAPWHIEPHAGGEWPRLDGARVLGAAPAGFDARLTWELNRGHDWVVLARAHAATGDVRYRERLSTELTSWGRENPLGIGINWSSAMEAAIRIHALIWVAGLAGGDGDLARMIYEHATFVADHLSTHSSANNHRLVELTGLAVAARAIGGRWRAYALDELADACRDQIFEDGVHAEMATHYHAFVLEALLLVAHLERLCGEPCVDLEQVIAAMADYLATLTCGDVLLAQGDSDDGKILPLFATRYEQRLVTAARSLSRRGDIAWLAPAAGTEHVPARSRHFTASGQVVLRSPRLVATFDAGAFGFGTLAAHAHCDALAINVAVDGKRLFVDRGTYRYNSDPAARDRYRMTAAHNTLQLRRLEQGQPSGPFLWSRRPDVRVEQCELTDVGDYVRASHDGFGPRHRRTLVRRGDLLLVCDELDGRGTAIVRFHAAPELELAATPLGCVARDSVTGATIGWCMTTAGRARIVSYPHSDRYLASTAALTWELETKLDGEAALISIVGPGSLERAVDAVRELVVRAKPRLSRAGAHSAATLLT